MKIKALTCLIAALMYATASLAASGHIITHAGVTLSSATQAFVLSTSNPGRSEVCCQNYGATNDAWVGDVSTAVGQGFHLDPDLKGVSGVCIATTDPVYGYSTGGTTVTCSEVLNP